MKKKLLFNVFTPSILCLLIIVTTKMSIVYFPLSFGLIIGLFNINNYRLHSGVGFILILITSYIVFWSFYFLFFELTQTLKPLLGEDSSYFISFLISVFILAPISLFYVYKFILKFPKTKTTHSLYIISICVLIITILMFNQIINTDLYKYLKKIGLHQYTFWQVIMALAIQSIIYQDKITFFTKTNN